jgi:hypothetical protein
MSFPLDLRLAGPSSRLRRWGVHYGWEIPISINTYDIRSAKVVISNVSLGSPVDPAAIVWQLRHKRLNCMRQVAGSCLLARMYALHVLESMSPPPPQHLQNWHIHILGIGWEGFHGWKPGCWHVRLNNELTHACWLCVCHKWQSHHFLCIIGRRRERRETSQGTTLMFFF